MDYFNFLSFNTVTLTKIDTAISTRTYTIDFWILIYAYVPTIVTFSNFEIFWDFHTKVEIIYDSGANVILTRCFPSWDQSNKLLYTLFSTVPMNLNEWTYIRCSANAKYGTFFHKTSGLNSMTNPIFTQKASIPKTKKVTLVINENSPDKNYGALFLQQLRLWNCDTCLKPFMGRMPIYPDVGSSTLTLTAGIYVPYPSLLHIWSPDYLQSTDGNRTQINNPVRIIKDYTMKSPNFTPTVNMMFYPMGYSEFDPDTYKKLEPPTVCVAGTLKCLNVPYISDFNDIVLTDVPISLSGQYTMEFWLKFNSISKLNEGFSMIWKNHMAISFIHDYTNPGKLYQMLFPQDYLSSPLDLTNQSLIDKYTTNMYNKDDEFNVTVDDGAGTYYWLYFRAGVTFSDKKFYLNKQVGATTTEKILDKEILFMGSSNSYPSRYFFQSGERTTFIVNKSFSPNSPVLLRTLNLYTDYLPPTYLIKNV